MASIREFCLVGKVAAIEQAHYVAVGIELTGIGREITTIICGSCAAELHLVAHIGEGDIRCGGVGLPVAAATEHIPIAICSQRGGGQHGRCGQAGAAMEHVIVATVSQRGGGQHNSQGGMVI